MVVKSMFERIAGYMAVPVDNPDLLQARCIALSRMIPLLYFILVANSWVLTATFIDMAPLWLTVHVALLLSIICVARLFVWWRARGAILSNERAVSELKRTNYVAALLCIVFTAWAFALFPYGNAYAQSHIAFFLTISMIGTMFCLIHLRSAALIVAAVVCPSFVVFFASRGVPTFTAMAINVLLVITAAVIVILIQSRDFARMVNSQAESRRREQEQKRLLHMIDDMPVAVMTVDPATFNINYANDTSRHLIDSIEHLLPIKSGDLVGTSIDVFHKHPEHQRRLLADPANLPHNARIRLGPEVIDLKVSAVTGDDGSYIGPMLTWAIVTKEAESESRIRQLAHYDTLTGFANRTTFHEQLEASLAQPGNRVGLLFIDLDGFKLVNDSRGHRIGDALLRQVADRLRATCNGRCKIIGRIGGDEFAVLLEQTDTEQAEALSETLLDALSTPFLLGYDTQVQIGASIGIVLAPMHGDNGETLLSRADIALYAAKAAGKCTFRMFSAEMEHRIQERVRLEVKLRAALENRDNLFVFYQPIVDIETGKVTAREALVRWYHPKRGWVSPGEFIPVAEQSSLIDQLGLFVLNRACRDAAGWEDGERVAVNISANQLGKGTLAQIVLSALTSSGLSPDRLEVEVTETALLSDEANGISDLRQLRDMGVRVALDDFGTGYSSLAHLRAFTFDKIKIDGSFVKDAAERPDCAAVVKAIADLGKRLGVTTVAEGVETQAQLDRIREEGCREVQGYLYGRPMPSAQDAPLVAELNREWSKSPAV
ncbi:putative signaling protein [Methylophilaceae bacterium]|nr:putative signaling protein [Methylophilaceae bacterium]